jgi:hypothetical protein
MPLCLGGTLGVDLSDGNSYEEGYRRLIHELTAASTRQREENESPDGGRGLFQPDERIEILIKDVKLASWGAAEAAALKVIEATEPASMRSVSGCRRPARRASTSSGR